MVDLSFAAECRDQPGVRGRQHRIGRCRDVGGSEIGEGSRAKKKRQAEATQSFGKARCKKAEVGVLAQRGGYCGIYRDGAIVAKARLMAIRALVGRQEMVRGNALGEIEHCRGEGPVNQVIGPQPIEKQEIKVMARREGK